MLEAASVNQRLAYLEGRAEGLGRIIMLMMKDMPEDKRVHLQRAISKMVSAASERYSDPDSPRFLGLQDAAQTISHPLL